MPQFPNVFGVFNYFFCRVSIVHDGAHGPGLGGGRWEPGPGSPLHWGWGEDKRGSLRQQFYNNTNWSSQVWAHNLEDEFKEICRIVTDFPYVAMDTEFPGVVARPIGEFKSTSDYQYQVGHRQPNQVLIILSEIIFFQLLRCNVDLLKIIQLGLTFFNKEGETPEGVCTWQVLKSLLNDCQAKASYWLEFVSV